MTRVFIQVEVPSEGYKERFKEACGLVPMSAEIKRLIEDAHPSLKGHTPSASPQVKTDEVERAVVPPEVSAEFKPETRLEKFKREERELRVKRMRA